MKLFIKTMSQLETEEYKNLTTNLSSKKEEQIVKNCNSLFNNKTKETVNQKLGKRKTQATFFNIFLLRKQNNFLKSKKFH